MKTHAKRIIFKSTFVRALIFWAVVCSFEGGGAYGEKISDIFATKQNSDVELCVPQSLRKCLETKLGISDVGNIRESCYAVRKRTYLGIEGTFLLDKGPLLYYSFVFSISNDENSWENAKVFRSDPMFLTYKDTAGQIINLDVDTVSSVAILPENILTSYLWEIHSIEESIWTEDAYAEWCRRMSKVTINPEKNTAPLRGAEGGSGSEENNP